jgi:2-polyprenyl-6-methoxyphenol hydroxylase-like FAD-dependent oxidoreductase
MRVLLSTYGLRGDVEAMVGLAVRLRALGAEMPVCASPEKDFAELLARVGAALVPVGQVAQVAGFAWIPLDISDFPTRHNYGLGLWQNHIERILAGWVGELGVPIYRGREVTGIAQDDTGVDVEVSDGRSLRAEYLVGCDGGRSLIRKAAGIEFPWWDPTTSCLIAEVEMAEELEWCLRRDDKGIHSLSRTGDGGPVRRCDILSRTHKGGSGWAATCWVSRRSTRCRSRSLAARARTWGSFRGSKASACRLAFA